MLTKVRDCDLLIVVYYITPLSQAFYRWCHSLVALFCSHCSQAQRWPVDGAWWGLFLGLCLYFRFQNLHEHWDSRFQCIHFTTWSPHKMTISNRSHLYQGFLIFLLFCTKGIQLQSNNHNSRILTTSPNIFLLQTYNNTSLWCCQHIKSKVFGTSSFTLRI